MIRENSSSPACIGVPQKVEILTNVIPSPALPGEESVTFAYSTDSSSSTFSGLLGMTISLRYGLKQ